MSYKILALICIATMLVAAAASATTKSTAKPATAPSATTQVPDSMHATPAPAVSTKAAAPATSAAPTSSPGAMATPAKKPPAKPVKKVDLNNASLAELKTLPTVTDEYAKTIIANRPYKSKGELVTKAKLPEGVYQAVRDHVEMQSPRKAPTTKTGKPKASTSPKSDQKAETK